jgi:hypothetical protein
MLDPIDMKSKMDVLLANVVTPYNDKLDPNLKKARREKEDPNVR